MAHGSTGGRPLASGRPSSGLPARWWMPSPFGLTSGGRRLRGRAGSPRVTGSPMSAAAQRARPYGGEFADQAGSPHSAETPHQRPAAHPRRLTRRSSIGAQRVGSHVLRMLRSTALFAYAHDAGRVSRL